MGALTLGFLALAVSTVVMVAKAASADAERRKYYFCNTFICGVATFSYFAMLSGQGWTAIAGCRQFFYARYVDWTITTALLILDLGLVAGQDFVTIAAVIGADMLMITAGYMGAVSVVTTVKWFWFLFGMAMFLPVIYSLARTFRETVITRKVCPHSIFPLRFPPTGKIWAFPQAEQRRFMKMREGAHGWCVWQDPEMIELYGKIAWLTIIMWSFYPVVWLFSEGFASFSVSFEVLLRPTPTPPPPDVDETRGWRRKGSTAYGV